MTKSNSGSHIHLPCGASFRKSVHIAAEAAGMSSAAWCRMVIGNHLGITVVQPQQGGYRAGAGRPPRPRVTLPTKKPNTGRPKDATEKDAAVVADLQRRGYPKHAVAALARLSYKQVDKLWTAAT